MLAGDAGVAVAEAATAGDTCVATEVAAVTSESAARQAASEIAFVDSDVENVDAAFRLTPAGE